MKKVLLVLLMFLMCACNSTNNESNSNSQSETLEFISPVEDTPIFSYLNSNTAALLKEANDGKDLPNKALTALGKELSNLSLTTINNETINLEDYKNSKLVIEVVATTCSHCKEQTYKYTNDLLNRLNDVTFIQYFIGGDTDTINAFYKEIGVDILSDEIVCVDNEEFDNYLKTTLDVDSTPTFLFFNNGTISYFKVGTTTLEQLNKFYSYAFENALDLNDLVDEQGKSIFDYVRNQSDVMRDLSNDNYYKLKELDNDGATITVTLNNIGKTFDFYDQLENESSFESEVNFLDYVESDLMVIRLSEYDEELFNLLNTFYKENKDVSIIAINMTDEDNDLWANKLDMPMCSIMNQIPAKLNEENLGNNPSCIFIKSGTITGVYSNIQDLDTLVKAKNTFLTDESIALLKNNTK